jgi:pimeloyl-ACP methyl ester carboxylesterase
MPSRGIEPHPERNYAFCEPLAAEVGEVMNTVKLGGRMGAHARVSEVRWTSNDGVGLFCRVYEGAGPEAPAVLCLPGLTRNSRDFEALALHLAGRYRIVCPDLRGRGLSGRDPNWHSYQLPVYVADLLGLMHVLRLGRMAIIGTSLGGLLAMVVASIVDSVAGIVLNDIGPQIEPAGAARIKSYVGQMPPVGSWEEAISQLRAIYSSAWPDLSEEMWAILARRSFREDISGTPVLDFDPNVGAAIRAAPETTADLWPLFSALRTPILVIRGALSDILSAATVERMQREKPDLVSLTLPNRGHVPLLDEPESLAAIDAFLERVVGPGAMTGGQGLVCTQAPC